MYLSGRVFTHLEGYIQVISKAYILYKESEHLILMPMEFLGIPFGALGTSAQL